MVKKNIKIKLVPKGTNKRTNAKGVFRKKNNLIHPNRINPNRVA